MKTKTKPFVPSKEFIEAVRAQNKSRELFKAIEAKGEDVSKVIKAIDDGANLNLPFDGQLPLEFAILHGKFERFKTIAAKPPTVGEIADLKVIIEFGEKKIKMTLLHYAATLGRALIVKYLVSRGLDTTIQDGHPRRLLPIHYAARSGDCPTLDALNDQRQALEAVSGSGDFPLHIAAEHGKLDMVRLLLDMGADINCRDLGGRLPVHRAAQRGRAEMVEFLLTQKITKKITSRNYWDNEGRNSFLFAIESDNTALVTSLILPGDEYTVTDLMGMSAMHILAKKNKVKMMKFLNGRGGLTCFLRDKNGAQPIHIAVEYNSMTVFDWLVAEMRKVLRESLAVQYKPDQLEKVEKIELIKMLLSYQDEAGDTVIEYAVRGNATEIIKKLIELGVNLNRANKLGCTPMHEAVRLGNVAMMSLLNAQGLSYTQKNNAEQMPMHVAIEHEQIEVLKTLRKLPNFDFKACDAEKRQPFFVACATGKRKVVDWFIDEKICSVEEVDERGRNCLLHAVRGDQDGLINYLVIDKNMRLNSVCKAGYGPMHHAVCKSAKKAVVALKALGVSLDTPSEKGISPLLVACRNGLPAMVTFLVENGAERYATDSLGRNAWFYAATTNKGVLDCLDNLQVKLSDVKDNLGMNPVHAAAIVGNLDAVKFFHTKQLDCFAEDKKRETPLMKARKHIKKYEAEINAIKMRPAYLSGKDAEAIAKCEELVLKADGYRAVESYLMYLEKQPQQASSNFASKPVPSPQSTEPALPKQPVLKKHSADKPELEPNRDDASVIRTIVKPKKWVPPKNEPIDLDGQKVEAMPVAKPNTKTNFFADPPAASPMPRTPDVGKPLRTYGKPKTNQGQKRDISGGNVDTTDVKQLKY